MAVRKAESNEMTLGNENMKKGKGGRKQAKTGNGRITDIELDKASGISALSRQLGKAGFQATNLREAVDVIKEMKARKATVYFSFTANMVASGLRGVIKDVCRKGIADVVVTTAGSLDHDVIKSFMPYEMGSFNVDDVQLHKKGINRIGNVFVHNSRYVLFEKKIQGIFSRVYERNNVVSPSELCREIGKHLDKSSFLYWCAKNNTPVFCPGITDGAIGLQMYFFKQEHPDFIVDVTADMKHLADIVLGAEKAGGIILGGGISKHHIIGANIVRDGLDYAVYVSTAQEYDGSLSGAQTKEAKSWGKIRQAGRSVNVTGDASILFPIIMKAYFEETGK